MTDKEIVIKYNQLVRAYEEAYARGDKNLYESIAHEVVVLQSMIK